MFGFHYVISSTCLSAYIVDIHSQLCIFGMKIVILQLLVLFFERDKILAVALIIQKNFPKKDKKKGLAHKNF